MRRVIGIVLLAAGLVVTTGAIAAEAPPQQGFVELFKASTQAHQAKDYKRMEQLLRDALKLRPVHPTATYNLAAALVLGGQKNAGVKELRKLARMGLTFDIAADEDFAGIREWQGFRELRRDFARNARAAGEANVTFTVPAPSFIPEGLAYDPASEDFFIGSVRERRILRIKDEQPVDFTPAGSTWAVLGLTVDADERRLWAATAAIAEMKDAKTDELGRAALVTFDLKSGALQRRYELPQDGRRHALGDVIVGRKAVYATDSAAGELYALDPAGGAFQSLTARGALSSPQGLVMGRDRRTLYVADYTQGLYRIDVEKRELTRLEVADDICVYGIDGLYRFGDDLIAVQNGIRPHRVVRFILDRSGKRVRHATVLASGLKEFDEPTLGVIEGRRFHFVANSQWHRFDKDHALPPDAQLRGPVVLQVRLDRRRPTEGDSGRGVPGEAQPAPAPLELPPVGLPRVR